MSTATSITRNTCDGWRKSPSSIPPPKGWPMERYPKHSARSWYVSSHFIEYLRPALLGDEITVYTWGGRHDGAEFAAPHLVCAQRRPPPESWHVRRPSGPSSISGADGRCRYLTACDRPSRSRESEEEACGKRAGCRTPSSGRGDTAVIAGGRLGRLRRSRSKRGN